MLNRIFARTNVRPDTYPRDNGYTGRTTLAEARVRAAGLALGIRLDAHAPPRGRPHRGRLPDVDFSQVTVVERPSLAARIVGLFGRSRTRDRGALAKPDMRA